EQRALGGVERPHADERHPRWVDSWKPELRAFELGPREAERGRERHSVDIAARRCLRPVEVTVGVEPEDAALSLHLGEPAERSERDGVVAAEHEREEVFLDRAADELGHPLARLLDLRQEANALVADRARLGDPPRDLPP